MPSEPDIMEPTLWRRNGWTARVIKNEDDDGWAVEIRKAGLSEPALISPWVMGRDKKVVDDGLTFVLEITHVIDTLHLAGALNVAQLQVRLVPIRPVPEAAQVSIGRISIFRQSN